MTCYDCGQATLFDGVCIDCSNKRFNDYPRLKKIEELIKKRVESPNKVIVNRVIENEVRSEFKKILEGHD